MNPSTCMFWCAVALGSLVKGSPVESVSSVFIVVGGFTSPWTGFLKVDLLRNAEAVNIEWHVPGQLYMYRRDISNVALLGGTDPLFLCEVFEL